MRGPSWAVSLLSALIFSKATAQSYALIDDYSPQNWFDKFNFFTSGDPTNGFVQYVNESVAAANGLIGLSQKGDRVYMGVDHTNTYNVNGPGRPSVRVHSKKLYNHGLFILDLNHMPVGCGAWPAWWTLGQSEEWPHGGEIDIIEGVNTNLNNTNKIYSGPGCSITGTGQTAIADSFNCNDGCGSASTRTDSYGDGFNNVKGGVYAMEWTSRWIRVWFFPRSSTPTSISTGSPDISEFGIPMANFQGGCDIDNHFSNHTIIFDITFCGDWAGPTFGKYAGCPMTSNNAWTSCNNFVASSPQSFANAYWDINYMRVFQQTSDYPQAAQSQATISDAVPLSSSVGVPLGKGGSATALSVSPVIPTTAGYKPSIPIANGAEAETPSPSSSRPGEFFAAAVSASSATPSAYAQSSFPPSLSGDSLTPSLAFTTSYPQPCSPIYGYSPADPDLIGYRHGIGPITGGLAMCQDNCADYPNCTDVLYVHYEGDFSSPLGYWDCWWGALDMANVACGGSARGGDGPGGLADAETQANVGVIGSGEVPDSSGDGSSGTVTDSGAGTGNQIVDNSASTPGPSADPSIVEGVPVLDAGQVTDAQKKRAAAASAARKRLSKRGFLAKRQAINMSPSPNVGVRVEDYQVLMHRSGDVVSSSAYGFSSSSATPSSGYASSLLSSLVSTPYGLPSDISVVQTPSSSDIAIPVNTPSNPDVSTPSALSSSVASVGFRSTSEGVLTPLVPLTPLSDLGAAPSSPPGTQTSSPDFTSEVLPNPETPVVTPSITDALTPTPPAEPSVGGTPSFSAEDTATILTASDDSYSAFSSSLSASISSSLSSELYSSLSSAWSIPESAYSAARNAVTSALVPAPLFNPAVHSSMARTSSRPAEVQASVSPPFSPSSSSSPLSSSPVSSSAEFSTAPGSSTASGFTFTDMPFPSSEGQAPGVVSTDIGSSSLAFRSGSSLTDSAYPSSAAGAATSSPSSASSPSSSTDDGYTTETLSWSPGPSESSSTSECKVLATVTVTVTRIVGPSFGVLTPSRTPVGMPAGTPGIFRG